MSATLRPGDIVVYSKGPPDCPMRVRKTRLEDGALCVLTEWTYWTGGPAEVRWWEPASKFTKAALCGAVLTMTTPMQVTYVCLRVAGHPKLHHNFGRYGMTVWTDADAARAHKEGQAWVAKQ